MTSTELVPIDRFRAHPLRDNVCVQDTQEKIKANVQRTGQMEPVSGYRDPEYPDLITMSAGKLPKSLGSRIWNARFGILHPKRAKWY